MYIFRSDGIIWSINGVILDLIMYGHVWLPHFGTEVRRIGYTCVVFPNPRMQQISLGTLGNKASQDQILIDGRKTYEAIGESPLFTIGGPDVTSVTLNEVPNTAPIPTVYVIPPAESPPCQYHKQSKYIPSKAEVFLHSLSSVQFPRLLDPGVDNGTSSPSPWPRSGCDRPVEHLTGLGLAHIWKYGSRSLVETIRPTGSCQSL